jgi:uncharacterized protein (TIGR00725 family)
MRLTIGVMGSSGADLGDAVRVKAYRLGEAIAARDAVLITGGCSRLPYEAVRGAKAKGGLVVGIYDDDPERLVDRLIHYYRTEHVRKPSCFCDARPDGAAAP